MIRHRIRCFKKHTQDINDKRFGAGLANQFSSVAVGYESLDKAIIEVIKLFHAT
jgi:hypothetical protein